MTVDEFEFLLFDRIEKIKSINVQYDLLNNAYISFSGGKDSTVLHYLIDMALPNNKIPRIYANTGIEYQMVRKFVERVSERDCRIIILNQTRNIKKMLEEYGYPFKSKEHSLRVEQYQKGINANYLKKYISGVDEKHGYLTKHKCPKILKYQFNDGFNLKISNLCCYKLKKYLMKKWSKDNNKKIVITGMRSEEGGTRARLNCLTNNGKNFHPMIVLGEEFVDYFIKKYNVELCRLYYPPFNFKRTGCKGCPFSLDLQMQLDVMKKLLPNEYKQCEILWKPVYDEYRRIGYRLRKDKDAPIQYNIFDFGISDTISICDTTKGSSKPCVARSNRVGDASKKSD